jgi:predicted DNA-binding transcriptional regulator AlpA
MKQISQRIEVPTNTALGFDALLNEHDIARITGMSVASVRRWRLRRHGPRYLKLGSACRYRPEDLTQWLESRPSGGGTGEVA